MIKALFKFLWIAGWGTFSIIPDIATRKYTKEGVTKIAVIMSWFCLAGVFKYIPDWIEVLHLIGIGIYLNIQGKKFLGGIR
jgi:hypothetical protein